MRIASSFTYLGLFALATAITASCTDSPAPQGDNDASVVPTSDARSNDSAKPPDPLDSAVVGVDVREDAAVTADTAPPPPDLLTPETITVGSRTRSFGVRIPKTYDPLVAYPVVFLFHGNGGDGASLYGYFKFQVASRESAILVYPNAENLDWDLYTPMATNKDIAFVDAMVASLSARYTVDDTKIFGWGWSNGAFFVNQVACRRSGLFRGIASHAGGAPYEPSDPNRKWPNGAQQCPGQTAVPFLGFHGDQDPVVGIAGGEYNATYWAYVNGCGGTRVATTPAPCAAYPSCSAGKPVVFCSIPGFGHGIWDQAAKASWDFFRSL